MTDKDIEKAAGKAAGSKTEKNFLQDQMKYQRDANQASATSIHGEDAAGITKQNKSIDGLPKPDTEYKDPVEWGPLTRIVNKIINKVFKDRIIMT